MKPIAVCLLAVVLVLASALPGEAQQADEPEDVVMKYSERLLAADYAGAAAWLHHDELRTLCEVFRSVLAAEPDNESAIEIFSVRDSSEFLQLSPEEVAARFLKFSLGDVFAELKVARMEVVKRLPSEDPEVVVVHTRLTLADHPDALDVGPLDDVVWLRKHAAEWRVLFRPGWVEYFVYVTSPADEDPFAYDEPEEAFDPDEPAMDEEPEAFALRYARTLMRRDHAALAALMHRDELRQLRQTLRAVLAADRTGNLAPDIFLVRDSTEFLRLSPEEVGTRFLRWTTPHSDFGTDGVLDGMRVRFIERIGSADADVVAVKFRVTFRELEDAPGFAPMEDSVRLRRQDTEWRALFSPRMSGLLQEMSGRGSRHPDKPTTGGPP